MDFDQTTRNEKYSGQRSSRFRWSSKLWGGHLSQGVEQGSRVEVIWGAVSSRMTWADPLKVLTLMCGMLS